MNGRSPYKLILALALAAISSASIAEGITTDVSGFARVVAGQLNNDAASYAGYDDSITLDQNSLFGLQGQVKFNEQFSATALGLVHSNERETGLEWFYLSYKPTTALNIKLGQMQTPFYSISDSLDVGFSYPWVIAPNVVYGNFVFKTFQGIDVRYTRLFGNVTANIEAYYGNFEGDINDNDTNIELKVNNMLGLIGDLRISNFSFRASVHRGDVDLSIADIDAFAAILSQQGFTRSADSLNPDSNTHFFQMSAEYDSLKYFLRSEWTKLKTNSIIPPNRESYYFTYGHYFNNLTALITYGLREDKLPNPVSGEIPENNPLFAPLLFGYQSIYNDASLDDTKTWSLGLRWDVIPSLALKSEYQIIKSKNDRPTSFLIDEGAMLDRKSNLFLVGLELVF